MIRAENLTRSYGDFKAVNDVSFEITQGEIVGLLGHNGAGKTTILKMLTGFLEPTSGTVKIDSLDIRRERKKIQRIIGYLPENCPLYSEMTVIDYLDYTASLHNVEQEKKNSLITTALLKTDLIDKATHTISTLSRGYRQRVGVAQAILHEPRILILDEPTNGLDPTQIQHMRKLITNLAKHSTVIISTHILQEVQAVCDRVIIINSGRKAVDSRLDELQTDSKLILKTDAAPEKIQSVIKEIKGVKEASELPNKLSEPGYIYRLALDAISKRHIIAAAVAKNLISKEWHLYGLYPEARNLETVFAEVSSRNER